MKKFLFIVIFSIFSVIGDVSAQSWDWVSSYGYNTYCTEEGTCVDTDSSGNIYIKEETICVITGPGSTVEGSDYLFKYDSSGNLIWQVKCIQGDIASDKHGNTYIAGFFQICKIDSSGNTVWTTDIPNRYFKKVALHPQGGIVAAGEVPFANCSSVIYRLDENGNILWNQVGDYHCPYTMTVDKNGKSYLLMHDRIGIYDSSGNNINHFLVPNAHYKQILVGNDLSIYTISHLASYPNNTITLNKYSGGNNALEWSRNLIAKHGGVGSAGFDQSNNLILGGSYWDIMSYDNVSYTFPKSLFIMGIDNHGTLKWIKNNPSSEQRSSNALATFNNNIFVTGRIYGNHNFDQITVVAEEDKFDMFVAKLNMPTIISSLQKENILINYLNTYPSPSDGIFYADLSAEAKGSLSISNAIGQIVYSESFSSAGNFKSRIDISSQPKGLYILKCETEKGTFTRKIVLQ